LTIFPFHLLPNNQDLFFIHHDKHQQILIYEISQLEEPPEGQTRLVESVNPLPDSKLINLPYKQIKFKFKFNRFLLQIDYKEILAIIDIFNNLNPPPTPSPYQLQINISSREIQLIHHIIESPSYQYQLI
jgi:hypothetical protein